MGVAAHLYAPTCEVTVNGGDAMTTPSAVSQFLCKLRNEMGGTNMKFTITGVDTSKFETTGVCAHTDTWTADNGSGSCIAEWSVVDGRWRIMKDQISFAPK